MMQTIDSPRSSAEASKLLVARFFREVWNPPFSGEIIDELLSKDFAVTTDGIDVKGRETFKMWIQGLQSMIDDLKIVPQEIIATDDGERVISRLVATGRNNGMFGTEPDGAPVELSILSIIQIERGKIVRNWVEKSSYELYQRLTSNCTANRAYRTTKSQYEGAAR